MLKMAKVLITGSADGIGLAGAQVLASQGHHVYLHARNDKRAEQARSAVPKAAGVLIGDMSTVAATKKLAEDANHIGRFDAVIHNAGLGPGNSDTKTSDGFASTFAVNSLAPYILTCLMEKPSRLLYLSSGLHSGGDDSLDDITWQKRKKFEAFQAYSDSKLHDVMLANAVARRWPDVQSCSMDPGWIKTKMGGSGAPGSTDDPAKAIAEFAIGESGGVVGTKSGLYFHPSGVRTPHKGATDERKQNDLMKILEELSGVEFP